jgi:hypothetical protein
MVADGTVSTNSAGFGLRIYDFGLFRAIWIAKLLKTLE